MSANPYQAWFDKLDATVAGLADSPADHATEAVALLRQAAFVVANYVNMSAQVLPVLLVESGAISAETTERVTETDAEE